MRKVSWAEMNVTIRYNIRIPTIHKENKPGKSKHLAFHQSIQYGKIYNCMSDQKIPKHLAIIPDGNRRWAKERGLPSVEGHREGAKRFIEVARAARSKGIHTITIWGFSTENWSREVTEVHYLMDLFLELLKQNEEEAHKEQIRLYHFGRKDRLPTDLAEEIKRIEKSTEHYTKHILNLCLDYGGQNEIIRAINKIIKDENKKDPISEADFEQYLDTAGQPHPFVDLLIRTSGEKRTSGLLPFQMAYAEFYFESAPMPEFDTQKLEIALEEYANRDRRFGGNSAY
jgi:undecaprenyl diphosphate synthase